MKYFSVVVPAHKDSFDKRKRRYRYLAYDEAHAYKQFMREEEPNARYSRMFFKNEHYEIKEVTQEEWENTTHKYSLNKL